MAEKLNKHRGKFSFGISILLVLLLNILKVVTFDSVMPYLVGIGLWAVIWNFYENDFTRQKTISIIPAILLSAVISLNLCVENFLEFPHNIISGLRFILACAVISLLVKYLSFKFPSEKLARAVFSIGSILFGIFSCAGHYGVFESIAMPLTHPLKFALLSVLSICSWTILFSITLNVFHFVTVRINLINDHVQEGEDGLGHSSIVWGISFFVCMICYLPYLLTYYPGVIEYDSWIQIRQVFGEAYSNHHPWLHTMLIKAVYNVGIALFHSENRAIALYSLCSMGMLSAAFATAIVYLYKRRVKACWLILILSISALSPINGIYSITMWKDIPFASTVLFFIILLCQLEDNSKQQKRSALYWGLFVLVSFLMCFFRSNGLYVFMLMIPVMLYIFRRQKKPLIYSVVLVIVMAIIYKGPVFEYFEVANADLIESLSIPAQQIAAVISYDGNIEENDLNLLGEIIDIDKVTDAYLSSQPCSDAIKDLVRETDNQQYISNHIGEFLSLWLKLGFNNKYYYIKAYIDETKGFWYHKTTGGGMWATHLFDAVEGLGIKRQCMLPDSIADVIPNLLNWNKVHFSKYYSCGLYIYILIFCFIESLRQKKEKWYTTIPLLGIWLTLLIATPYFSNIRYIYAIHVALPYVMSIIMIKDSPETC